MRRCNVFGRVCVRVGLLMALTFESLDLESSSLVHTEHLGQGHVLRSRGQGQGHTSVTKYTFAGGPSDGSTGGGYRA